MGLVDLFRSLATDKGIEIDETELAQLGLSDDGHGSGEPELDVLGDELPGHASGFAEIFLAAGSTSGVEAKEMDGLMWEPIIREGQWAVRPGGKTGKLRKPLKVIAGHSKDQRKEIGLQDIKEAFDDEAIEHVTVPTSHNNTVLENTGFIKGLKIVEGTVKDRKTKGDVKVKVLMGGYDIRLPDVKKKMTLGTIASRSAGILYDYVNTETGKTYPVALEHVALTNKPWITGMAAFGRKVKAKVGLSDDGVGPTIQEPVTLSLSDDEPPEEELLAAESVLGVDLSEEIAWDQTDSPEWLRQQVNSILSEKRSVKMKAKRNGRATGLYVEDTVPYYRCVEALGDKALVSDGWGDGSNYWVAPITVNDGVVELAEFKEWKAAKKAWVSDDRDPPPKDKEPLADQGQQTKDPLDGLSKLQLAQRARRERAGKQDTTSAGGDAGEDQATTTHSRGGEHMAGENGNPALELSEEAKAAIAAAEARAKAAEDRAEKLSQQMDRIAPSVRRADVEGYIAELKADGFDEEHGFSGVLAEVRELMMADDGEPALQGDHFATDGNTTGELTLSDAVKRIFKAFKRLDDGKIALGELLTQPSDDGKSKDGTEGGDGSSAQTETKTETKAPEAGTSVSRDGKPPVTPPAGSTETKSDDELADELLSEDPIIAGALGLAPAAAAGTKEGGA